MSLKFSTLLVVGSAAAIASCSTAPMADTRSPRAQQELARTLAGRTPGQPLSCIPNYRTTDMHVIDDWTIIFREGRTVYLQNPRGGCHGIANGTNTLVTRKYGTNQICSGDINQLIDLRSGVGGGACVFSEFVPYTLPRT